MKQVDESKNNTLMDLLNAGALCLVIVINYFISSRAGFYSTLLTIIDNLEDII